MSKGEKKASLVRILQRLAEPTYPGPQPSLTTVHLYKAIYLIGIKGPLGRSGLSSELAIGGGAVRTLVKRLKRSGIIEIDSRGCHLTRKGGRLFEALTEHICGFEQVKAHALALGHHNVAVHIRDKAPRITTGLDQRDAAVRARASGAVTLIYKRGRLVLPSAEEERSLDHKDPLAIELADHFQLKEKDVIIIASAQDSEDAENAALSAALVLIG